MLSEEFTPIDALCVPFSSKRMVGSVAFRVKISVGLVVPMPIPSAIACNICEPLGRSVILSCPKSM